MAEYENEMKADCKIGIGASQVDCVFEGSSADHEAGTRQHTLAMSADNGAVDGLGVTKVVAVDDQRDLERACELAAVFAIAAHAAPSDVAWRED